MKKRNIYIAENIWQRLVKVAEENGTNVSELIRRAVLEFLKREEDNAS